MMRANIEVPGKSRPRICEALGPRLDNNRSFEELFVKLLLLFSISVAALDDVLHHSISYHIYTANPKN
jgi:hypothetical protein